MLCRVSCEACKLSCLWTDDPRAFLDSVCLRYRHCRAELVYEDAATPIRSVKKLTVRRRWPTGSGAELMRAPRAHAVATTKPASR